MVEFGIVILPLMAILLLTMDVAWGIFAKSTIQYAVHQGVRYAVTGQILSGQSGLNASIQQIVSQNSFGFISSSQAASMVVVTYYSPTTLAQVTGAGSTAGGNVIRVSVGPTVDNPNAAPVVVYSFGLIFRTGNVLSLGAEASDVMESPPNGIAPTP